jgi:hypothetical protein
MLYSKLAASGAVINIVPVGVVQVGCMVTDAVGATGKVGKTFTVKLVAELMQPVVTFLTVTA